MKPSGDKIAKNEDGQSLVEFVLLFSIIVGLSFGFMRGINSNLADRWKAMAQVLLKDTDNQQTLDFR